MGITGLLPLMKAATSDVKLGKLSGTVAAIDTNGWIHRACYSCADKVYMNEETDMYVNYCITLCRILQKHNITPILVFDGQSLPAKAVTKAKRQQRKNEVRKKIDEMLRAGDNKGARWLMRQCVDVNFEMVHRVVQKCREEQIDYIVAPFEADAQIAYLVNHGIADYAITEDSDLLVFGCKKVLYKFDRDNEKGSMLNLERLDKCFNNFSERKFQFMCILSGCDYLENIPQVGLGRAKKFFENFHLPLSLETIGKDLLNLPSAIKMEGKVKVSQEYIKGFIRAVRTFDHQIVFSPFTGNFTHLKNLKGGLVEHDQLKLGEFAGDFFEQTADDFIIHYVTGNIHTKTMEKMDPDFVPHLLGDSSGKLSWFTEEFRKRVEARKSMNLISSSLFVPESPLKSQPNQVADTSREFKRKISCDVNDELSLSKTPAKRIKTVLKCSENEMSEEHKSTSQEGNDLTVSTKSLKVFNRDVEIERNGTRTSRTSSRNIFRKSETELLKSTGRQSSAYFQTKTESTSVTLQYEVVKKQTTKSSKSATPLKEAGFSDDSDLEAPDLNDEEEGSEQAKAKLNESVSSIEDEDKAALCSLNNSQSSGYDSQKRSLKSTPDIRSSQTSNDSFTAIKSQSSTSSRSSAKQVSARASKRSSGRASKTNTTSVYRSHDIRKFFKTTTVKSDEWIDLN